MIVIIIPYTLVIVGSSLTVGVMIVIELVHGIYKPITSITVGLMWDL